MTRLQTVLLLLLLGDGVSAGSLVDLDKRIVGGRTCNANDRLYHVKVKGYVQQRAAYNLCGGSLIHREWVLTAAHCWNTNWDVRVELGVHGGRAVEVAVTPEFYTDDPQNPPHDIILLRLDTPSGTPPVPQIQPVPLPNCGRRLQLRDAVQIAGFAAAQPHCTGGNSNTLQCADVHVVTCPWTDHQHRMCVQRTGVYGCPGDSGGGVVYNRQIYGVYTGCFSTGPPCPAGACPIRPGRTTPGRDCTSPHGFMDVCQYLNWINRVLFPPPGPPQGPPQGPPPGPGKRPAPGPAQGPSKRPRQGPPPPGRRQERLQVDQ